MTPEMEPLGADGRPYPALNFPGSTIVMGPGYTSSGCGLATSFDLNLGHPVASIYRFRVRYKFETGVSGTLEGTAGIDSIATLPPRVVINEFRTRGPNGATDQFVELFNDSLSASTVGASLCAGGIDSPASPCLSIPKVTIGPLCHYLITAPGFSGAVSGDLSMPAFLRDDGYITFIPPFDSFTQNDTVGMTNLIPSSYERTPLPPFGVSNTDRSYARTGIDTNDNSADFVIRSPSSPQNSTSCGSR